MFNCKACAAKDSHMKTLESEIAFLRALVRPKKEPEFNPLPIVEIEADAAISGNEEQIVLDPKRQAEIDAEAARLLSGTYGEEPQFG